MSQSYAQTHFQLIGNTFSYIYSSLDLITYAMQNTIHNIYIENAIIMDVAAGVNGIINIYNLGNLGTQDTIGLTKYIYSNGIQTTITIPKRSLYFTSLLIYSCSTGNSALYIYKRIFF